MSEDEGPQGSTEEERGTDALRQRRHRRRGRALVLALAGVAGVAAVVGTTLSPPADSAPTARAAVTPAATRLVGIDHAAIAVPEGWGTNETQCGTPEEDTVVIDVAVIPACLASRPEGVESLEVTQGRRVDVDDVDEVVEVDGVRAERRATTCRRQPLDDVAVCVGSLYLPSLGVTFHAASSTRAAEVDRILAQVRVVPDRVGVPGFQELLAKEQERSARAYVDALRAAGLVARVRPTSSSRLRIAYVAVVSPAPGTMLRPGDVVTVTAATPPRDHRPVSAG